MMLGHVVFRFIQISQIIYDNIVRTVPIVLSMICMPIVNTQTLRWVIQAYTRIDHYKHVLDYEGGY